MSTFEERKATMLQIAADPILDPKDKLKFLYHWYCNERNLRIMDIAMRRHHKHGKQLRNLIHLFNFQHDLENV